MLEEEEEYDSTWVESEEESGRPPSPARCPEPQEKGGSALEKAEDRQKPRSESSMWKKNRDYDKPRRRSKRAAMDLQRYRHHYPDLKDNAEHNSNVNFMFYMNKTCSQPNGCKILEMLTKWKGKYEHLERNHSYIQWLFPLREPGMNWWAKELTVQEIKSFRQSDVAKVRLIEAYKMMLDFYGIKLVNEQTGEVKRAHHWKQRFHNLNIHSHNNLRITRILKCLGELGFEHYQTPLVRFFLVETLINKQLPQVKDSVLDYFLYTIRNKSERRKLILFAQQYYQPLSEFVWGPPKGTEHRFSHICEELKKEMVEQQGEECSDEDMLTKATDVPSEADKEQTLKKRPSCPDSSKESAAFIKDTEQRSENLVTPGTLDTASSQEHCNAEEKVSCDGKPPVPENIERQTEDQEEDIAKGSEPIAPLKDSETSLRQKSEDNLSLSVTQVTVSETGCQQGMKSEDKVTSSGEPNLMTVEENKTTTQGHVRKDTTGLTDGIAEAEPAVAEDDKCATEGSKTGNIATGAMDERAEPGPGPNITGEERPTEEDTKRNTGTMDQNTFSESAGDEVDKQSVPESGTPSSAKNDSDSGEEMEIQEARPTDECQGEKDIEMKENDN
ncbi:opioid growth factor receptor-like protein 1 [Pristis pectinata]|uniref:opioid growth factor receptor-like protein 1 n=1 Tax=Pristis pectinata TaxID=685728 RepID=UPI00223E4DAB|nr:opioid growth factor receptor-like protein 1 [Pristis pectinata]